MPRLMILLVFMLLSACSIRIDIVREKPIEHIVVVWLKKPGNEADRAKLIQAGESLRAIAGLRQLKMGQCLPSKRPIVDSSYDVAFIMEFRNPAAMQAYLSHPTHQKAVREVIQPLARKVLVYDFQTE